MIASLGLAPQSGRVLAVEIIACAGVPAAVVLAVQLRHGPDNPADPIWWYLTRIATIQIPALLFLTCGITLALRHGGGLYWMLPATLTAFIGAVYTAWVLLVEIIRQSPVTSCLVVPARFPAAQASGSAGSRDVLRCSSEPPRPRR